MRVNRSKSQRHLNTNISFPICYIFMGSHITFYDRERILRAPKKKKNFEIKASIWYFYDLCFFLCTFNKFPNGARAAEHETGKFIAFCFYGSCLHPLSVTYHRHNTLNPHTMYSELWHLFLSLYCAKRKAKNCKPRRNVIVWHFPQLIWSPTRKSKCLLVQASRQAND